MPTKKTPSRTFTLSQLRQAIEDRLLLMGHKLPTPSVPTIKSWAAKGQVDQRASIVEQARNAVDWMLARERYYDRRPDTLAKAASQPQHADITALTQEVAKLQLMLAELSKTAAAPISNIGKASTPTQAVTTTSQERGELIRAIAQIDSVRQHLMLRFDSELTLLKQQAAGTGGGAGAGQRGQSADLMRFEGRLNRIENTQAQILEILQQLSDASIK